MGFLGRGRETLGDAFVDQVIVEEVRPIVRAQPDFVLHPGEHICSVTAAHAKCSSHNSPPEGHTLRGIQFSTTMGRTSQVYGTLESA